MKGDEKRELLDLIEELRVKHRNDFCQINEPVLVTITFLDGEEVYFGVDIDGITEYKEQPDIANQIILTYNDFKKVEKNRANLLRFLTTGRIKLKGNVRALMKSAEKFL